MTEPFVNNGDAVHRNPSVPGDGGIVADPAMIRPPVRQPTINGAPVTEQAHEFVVKKTQSDA